MESTAEEISFEWGTPQDLFSTASKVRTTLQDSIILSGTNKKRDNARHRTFFRFLNANLSVSLALKFKRISRLPHSPRNGLP